MLNDFAANVYSQNGEDGILERILELIGESNGWCVEFGAWDGLHFSNCANLLRNKGYAGVLIESDPARLAALQANYSDIPRVVPMKGFVGFGTDDNLDVFLAGVPIPDDPDVLSIDIDGNDYHVWAAVERLRPKVVCIEFNPTVPTPVEFVQPADPSVQQGCSPASLVKLGNQKGYELTCCTATNAVFVEERLFPRLGLEDNSLATLRMHEGFITYLFTGYDGRVFLSGYRRLPWQDVPFAERRVQQLPSFLRGYDKHSPAREHALRVFRRLQRFRSG